MLSKKNWCRIKEQNRYVAPGIYVHIPFCRSRCSYCDFATDVYRDAGGVERYVNALTSEIRNSKVQINGLVDTIYFGGGTPSLLDAEQVQKILQALQTTFEIAPNLEVTLEMNPATVTPEKLAAFLELGINRASFGVQTFNDQDLKLLARGHDANDARTTYRQLRAAGFANISFDLIAGLPGQTLDDWSYNLDEAISMEPEHLSLYLLEVHQGTPLAEQLRSQRRPPPDEELAAEMYELMIDRLAAAEYVQYEISNFSKPGFESRHNNKYWRLEPVYGFGVSAHSFDGKERFANERDTAKYVGLVENLVGAEVYRESIDPASEFAFLGLRLNEGIDLAGYKQRFRTDLRDKIANVEENGLVEIMDARLRLTRKGMLFSNEVFAELV
jgi:oxygen-independent coproporphyrinogen III oxidase